MTGWEQLPAVRVCAPVANTSALAGRRATGKSLETPVCPDGPRTVRASAPMATPTSTVPIHRPEANIPRVVGRAVPVRSLRVALPLNDPLVVLVLVL